MSYFSRISFVLLSLALLTAGCKKDNLTAPVDRTSVPRTLGEFIENNYDLSLLLAALKKTDLLDSLKQPGLFTAFLPDNTAFNEVGITSAKDFDKMNTDSLRFLLKYHIIRNRYFVSDFPQQLDNKYNTLAGAEVYVTIGKEGFGIGNDNHFVFVNGTMIMANEKRNIALTNGVIHIMRRPLNYTRGTVQDYIAADTNLTIFSAVMKRFGYWDDLKIKDPLTIFAPSNTAFLSYGITADSAGRIQTDRFKPMAFGIYPLLLRSVHVFSTDAYAISGSSGIRPAESIVMDSTSIIPNYQYDYFYKKDVAVIWLNSLKGEGQWVNNTRGPSTVSYYKNYLLSADRVASNGIIHVIDNLILNPAVMRK